MTAMSAFGYVHGSYLLETTTFQWLDAHEMTTKVFAVGLYNNSCASVGELL